MHRQGTAQVSNIRANLADSSYEGKIIFGGLLTRRQEAAVERFRTITKKRLGEYLVKNNYPQLWRISITPLMTEEKENLLSMLVVHASTIAPVKTMDELEKDLFGL